MKTPRIFGQNVIETLQGQTQPLDSGRFSNDGDLPVALTEMMLKADEGMRIQVRPTRGIEWSREPVPVHLLPNEFRGVGYSLANVRRWRLYNPFYLDKQDALNITLLNAGDDDLDLGMTINGVKDSDVTNLPKYTWTPRILYDGLHNEDAAITSHTFDTMKLRNWGDRPMCVHAIAIIGLDGEPDFPWSHQLNFDQFSLRIRLGGNLWMQNNEFVPVGALRAHWTNQIHIPNLWLKPDDAIYAQVQAQAAAEMRSIMIAVIGSVQNEVHKR